MVLHRLQRDILARLRQSAGPAAPVRLGFMEGPVPARRAATAAPPPPMLPPPPEVAAAAEAIPDPALRERFLESAARYLSRFREA
jgi:hypothetical protein